MTIKKIKRADEIFCPLVLNPCGLLIDLYYYLIETGLNKMENKYFFGTVHSYS
jgi:hypothetical protein